MGCRDYKFMIVSSLFDREEEMKRTMTWWGQVVDDIRYRDEYQESGKKEDVRVTMIRLRKRKTRIAVDNLEVRAIPWSGRHLSVDPLCITSVTWRSWRRQLSDLGNGSRSGHAIWLNTAAVSSWTVGSRRCRGWRSRIICPHRRFSFPLGLDGCQGRHHLEHQPLRWRRRKGRTCQSQMRLDTTYEQIFERWSRSSMSSGTRKSCRSHITRVTEVMLECALSPAKGR